MLIVISKDNGPETFVSPESALSFFRAFRDQLFKSGIYRDPQAGDEVWGVKIISITMGA